MEARINPGYHIAVQTYQLDPYKNKYNRQLGVK